MLLERFKFWYRQRSKVRKSVKVKRRDPIELYDTKLGYGVGGLYSNILHGTYKDACKSLEGEGVWWASYNGDHGLCAYCGSRHYIVITIYIVPITLYITPPNDARDLRLGRNYCVVVWDSPGLSMPCNECGHRIELEPRTSFITTDGGFAPAASRELLQLP